MTLKTLQEIQWRNTNVESNDRILQLKLMEGKKPLGITDLVDPRLFKGTNHLHATMDGMLWILKLEHGLIPEPLRQRWTTFGRALRAAKEYYEARNIEVIEVIS